MATWCGLVADAKSEAGETFSKTIATVYRSPITAEDFLEEVSRRTEVGDVPARNCVLLLDIAHRELLYRPDVETGCDRGPVSLEREIRI